MVRYYCRSDLLPSIEGALAANGYHVEVPLQRHVDGTSAMVMSCGLSSVLLAQESDHAVLEIEVWGMDQITVADLLESLPLSLYRQSPSKIVMHAEP